MFQPGIYRVHIVSPAYDAVGYHKIRVWNDTQSVEIPSVNPWSLGMPGTQTFATLDAVFEVNEATYVNVEHYQQNAVTYGLGSPANVSGMNEIFTHVQIWQLQKPNSGESV